MHWFTADLHLGHNKILAYAQRLQFLTPQEVAICKTDPNARNWRPSRESVQTMDDYLLAQINRCVLQDDTLWILGDFCFGPRNEQRLLDAAYMYRNRIKCPTVNLVKGNHDKQIISRVFQRLVANPDGSPKLDWRGDRQYDGYCTSEMIRPNGQRVQISHYAHAVWEKSHRLSWMLYGHSHSSAEPWLDKMMPGRRSIDVGVDNAKLVLGDYRPFSFDDLKRIFESRKGCSIDHHVEEKEET